MNYSQGKQKNTRHQLLKWSLAGFVLVPTFLVWLLIGSSLFGYRPVSINGISMEPALHHGDALWTKCLAPGEVKVGDIVCLEDPIYGLITHRLIKVQSLPKQRYLLETRGDANSYSETWEIGADETVRVSLMRVRFAGYVLEYLDSIFVRVLLGLIGVILIAMWVRRKRRGTPSTAPGASP